MIYEVVFHQEFDFKCNCWLSCTTSNE